MTSLVSCWGPQKSECTSVKKGICTRQSGSRYCDKALRMCWSFSRRAARGVPSAQLPQSSLCRKSVVRASCSSGSAGILGAGLGALRVGPSPLPCPSSHLHFPLGTLIQQGPGGTLLQVLWIIR